ncbi:cell division septal protein FtsQ [Desulfobotulus alkaliphilus]|uniref:Cell division septal protein FtsQ n=1 Tax=Desulfobotulus alkaliphilus TaxID=622671 RepID=A0A562RGE0_9BACT|nr:cell division septal protein FtsQ [Desulfobotulus alkaliphilus]
MSVKTRRAEGISGKKGHKKTKPNRRVKDPAVSPLRLGTKKIFPWVWRSAALLVLSLVMIFIHDTLTQSAFFEIRDIRIKGNEGIEQAAILEQIAIPENSNLLSLNLRLVRLRLESHPWIHRAAVNRKLPGSLEIEIREEEPFAMLSPTPDRRTAFWADSTGRIFKEVTEEDPKNYPAIMGLPLADTKENALWFGRAKSLLSLLQGPPHPLLEKDTTFFLWVDPDMGLGLADTEMASQIFFGFSDYAAKTRRLRILLQYRKVQDQTESMDTIDLVRPDRVVVIPAAA